MPRVRMIILGIAIAAVVIGVLVAIYFFPKEDWVTGYYFSPAPATEKTI